MLLIYYFATGPGGPLNRSVTFSVLAQNALLLSPIFYLALLLAANYLLLKRGT